MSPTPPRKRVELDYDQKREICMYYVEHSTQQKKFPQTELIIKFNKKFNLVIGTSTDANCDKLTFDEFMDYENGVPTGETLSDEDIVELVRKEESGMEKESLDKEESDVLIVEKNVSYSDLVESLDNLIKYNEQKKCFTEDEFIHFMQLTNKLRFCKLDKKQTSLDTFVRI